MEIKINRHGNPPYTTPAYTDWRSEQWEISPMGAGYSIRSVHNGNYVTIESGLADGTVVANPYPVSWVFDASDPEENVWKIGWPNNALCLNMEVVTYVLFAAYHKYSLHNISSDSVAK